MLRVGWSLNYSPLQLGESKFSFGYASNGKKCVDKTFEDYGDSFEKGDSIAAYLVCFVLLIIIRYEIFFSNSEIKTTFKDFESEPDMILISFSKNGIDQGVAFRIRHSELDSYVSTLSELQSNEDPKRVDDLKVFFPHVLTKNVVFEVNFGQRVSLIGDEPFAPIKNGFELIQKIPLEARFRNESRSSDRHDYEVWNNFKANI